MLIFIGLNLTVFWSSYLIAKRYSGNFPTLNFILTCFVFYIGQIVLTEQILGVFSRLTLLNLFVLNLLILVLVFVFVRKKKLIPELQEVKTGILQDKIILFALSVFSGFILVNAFVNLINPTFGWDCLNYHFTQPVEWLKHHNLINPITINDDPSPSYYPINGGLIYFWFIAPFKSAYVADLAQLPFYIISLIAVFAISRKAGLDNRLSFIAALTFGIIPNYFKEIEVGYTDVMMGCVFLLTLYFIVSLSHEFKKSVFLLASISLGLLLGIKTAALPYVVFLLLYLVWLLVKHKGIKKAAAYLPVVFVLMLIFGGYGFIRNAVLTGNPLYPLDFVLLGKRIFKGVMPLSNYHAQWTAADFNYRKLFFSEGLGAQFILLIVPFTLIAPLAAIRKKKMNLFVVLPIVLFLIFRYLIPQLWVRFLYPYLGVGSIVGWWGVKELGIKKKIIDVGFMLFILLSAAELAGHGELIASLILSLAVFGFLLLKNKYSWSIKKYIPLGAVILIFLMILGEKKYLKEEYDRYIQYAPFPKEEAEGWEYLNDITGKGANVAYVGRPEVFPLYGSGLKNNVYYVSVNGKEPYLHSYKNSYYKWNADYNVKHAVIRKNGNYRGNADYGIWLRNLKNKNIDYLFIYALHRITDFPFEDEWAKKHSEVFKTVFSNKLIHIYKISK